MRHRIDFAVVGAGPYGLAAAAHLRGAGRSLQVFGPPLQFWRSQTPKGMLLRSPYDGSNIGDPTGAWTIRAFEAHRGAPVHRPITGEEFIEYGTWFQEQVVPDLDRRQVERIERTDTGFYVTLADGEPVEARHVVVAAGVGAFAARPPVFEGHDASLVSHTLDHDDLGRFANQRITVVGGGQSALESAALLHEAGADVDVVVRAPEVMWLRRKPWLHERWPIGPLLYAPPDVGPACLSHVVARPQVWRTFRGVVGRLGPRVIRPAGARWLVPRLADVPMHVGVEVTRATANGNQLRLELSDGREQMVDHALLGTGYRVDFSRYSFLPRGLRSDIDVVDGWPRLSRGFETSVKGLYVLGAPAAWSYGPLMRFVAGSDFAARALVRGLAA